ncbi:MAG: hypothetical protein ACREWE_10965 [Gammaproteobacteria bacterium]
MRPLFRAFGIFLVVGGLSTLLQYLVLFTLVERCHADAILASGEGFAVSALLN